jgi:NADH:ubiquinone oxidoreductase subunit K
MTLNAVCVLAAALFALGLGSVLRRRSLVGFVIGIELALSGLILLAIALFDLSGMDTSTGGVIALAAITLGVGVAIVAAALHLWERRAGRRAEDLEPW